MKRRDDYDERPRRKTNTTLVFFLVGTACLFGAVVMGSVVAGVWWLGKKEPATGGAAIATPETDHQRIFSKAEFEGAVKGKSRDQIMAALGRPDHTQEQVPAVAGQVIAHFDWWIYRGRVMNDVTGKPYAEVRVRFGYADGTADRIEYY